MSQYEGKSDIQRVCDIQAGLSILKKGLDGERVIYREAADRVQHEILVDMFECLKNLQEKAT